MLRYQGIAVNYATANRLKHRLTPCLDEANYAAANQLKSPLPLLGCSIAQEPIDEAQLQLRHKAFTARPG